MTQPRTPPNPRTSAHGATEQQQSGNLTRCNGCQNVWTGLAAAHCSACHRTFTGFSAFDRHRTGSHAHGTRGCLDPATVGLVLHTRKHWRGWGQPGERPFPE